MAVLGLTTAAVTMAGCGSVPATGHDSLTAAAGIAGPALTTTLSASNGTSWAVLELGGSAATHNDFWELFVRPPGSAGWQLATPAGVASNGGMVAAQSGPASLIAAFRPSQDLTFSPLAATADAGHQWTQANVLDTGIANLPGALAAEPAAACWHSLSTAWSSRVPTSARLGRGSAHCVQSPEHPRSARRVH